MLTPRFLTLVASGVGYFLAMGMVLPVLPEYVEGELGGGGVAVGLTLGAFGLTAALLRPFVGALGDGRGRRFLVVTGAIAAALSVAGNVFAHSVAAVVALRLLTGVGEAAYFVGIASAVQDLAPDDRRGEAASYFSLTVYGGLAVGPVIGEALFESVSVESVWLVGGALALGAALFGQAAPGPVGEPRWLRPDRLFHPGAVAPAVVMTIGLLGYATFLAFGALYAEDVGIERVGSLFAVFAVVVLGLRLVGARLPDKLGPLTTTAIALTSSAIGLLTMASWQAPAGMYSGVVVLAVGQTFLFPALFVVAVDSAPANRRSQAIGTFTMSMDLAVGFGGLLAGGVVALTSEPVAFGVGGGFCLVALVVSRVLLRVPEPTGATAPAGPTGELGPATARRRGENQARTA